MKIRKIFGDKVVKVTYEFNTDSDNFDYHEYQMYKQAPDMARALNEIFSKLRNYEKWDERESIPKDELRETMVEALRENNVSLEEMGY